MPEKPKRIPHTIEGAKVVLSLWVPDNLSTQSPPLILWGNGIWKRWSKAHYCKLHKKWSDNGFVVIAVEDRWPWKKDVFERAWKAIEELAQPGTGEPISGLQFDKVFVAGKSAGSNGTALFANLEGRSVLGYIGIAGGFHVVSCPALYITGTRDFANGFVRGTYRAHERAYLDGKTPHMPTFAVRKKKGHMGLDTDCRVREATTLWLKSIIDPTGQAARDLAIEFAKNDIWNVETPN